MLEGGGVFSRRGCPGEDWGTLGKIRGITTQLKNLGSELETSTPNSGKSHTSSRPGNGCPKFHGSVDGSMVKLGSKWVSYNYNLLVNGIIFRVTSPTHPFTIDTQLPVSGHPSAISLSFFSFEKNIRASKRRPSGQTCQIPGGEE